MLNEQFLRHLVKQGFIAPSTASGWRKSGMMPEWAWALKKAHAEIAKLQTRIDELETTIRVLKTLD